MRVAIVTETYPPEINGVALTVATLAHGLGTAGHKVQVIRPEQPQVHSDDGVERTLLVRGMRLPLYPGLRMGLPCARQLRALWKSERPDAIYVATEGPLGGSALRAARHLGIPVSTGFHTRFDDFARYYHLGFIAPAVLAYLRRFHRRADATFVPTAELRHFLDTRGFGRVLLLRRAVDTGLFDPHRRDESLRTQWGLEPGQLAVIHVGRIAPEKNLALAVRAFRAIQQDRADARFIWVGDGPARTTLQKKNPDFIFCGMQHGQALACHYASADLFLFPSLTETFGNVTLEALASGLPVVAFDYGAAREHVIDDCGRRIAFGDEDGFVHSARGVAGAAGLASTMRSAARRAVAGLDPLTVTASFAGLLAALARPAAGVQAIAAANGSTP
ncbi:MAG: glycosyltransferase family 1 protein [Rudaea sp.]|nr:glycosyltransferase family 1 protein [Rudaea sp.]